METERDLFGSQSMSSKTWYSHNWLKQNPKKWLETMVSHTLTLNVHFFTGNMQKRKKKEKRIHFISNLAKEKKSEDVFYPIERDVVCLSSTNQSLWWTEPNRSRRQRLWPWRRSLIEMLQRLPSATISLSNPTTRAKRGEAIQQQAGADIVLHPRRCTGV